MQNLVSGARYAFSCWWRIRKKSSLGGPCFPCLRQRTATSSSEEIGNIVEAWTQQTLSPYHSDFIDMRPFNLCCHAAEAASLAWSRSTIATTILITDTVFCPPAVLYASSFRGQIGSIKPRTRVDTSGYLMGRSLSLITEKRFYFHFSGDGERISQWISWRIFSTVESGLQLKGLIS